MQAAAGVFGDSSGECLNAMIWWVILLNVQCGWLLLLIFLSVWVLILDHLVNYSRKVKNRCRCPLQTIVCMLMLIFVLLCYFIWFTWIVLLCWPASCSCYFDWRVMLYDVFFFVCKLLTDFISAMKLLMVVMPKIPYSIAALTLRYILLCFSFNFFNYQWNSL